jgi:hypothetical protein
MLILKPALMRSEDFFKRSEDFFKRSEDFFKRSQDFPALFFRSGKNQIRRKSCQHFFEKTFFFFQIFKKRIFRAALCNIALFVMNCN